MNTYKGIGSVKYQDFLYQKLILSTQGNFQLCNLVVLFVVSINLLKFISSPLRQSSLHYRCVELVLSRFMFEIIYSCSWVVLCNFGLQFQFFVLQVEHFFQWQTNYFRLIAVEVFSTSNFVLDPEHTRNPEVFYYLFPALHVLQLPLDINSTRSINSDILNLFIRYFFIHIIMIVFFYCNILIRLEYVY